MRKFFIAVLALVYITVSSGVAITIHYCMGRVSSVDVMQTRDKCGKCGMKINSGCCKDEFKIVKLSDSHKLISNEINIFSPPAVIENPNCYLDAGLFSPGIKDAPNNHSPPVSTGISLTILNRVFRI